jgi:hypothetical protein
MMMKHLLNAILEFFFRCPRDV